MAVTEEKNFDKYNSFEYEVLKFYEMLEPDPEKRKEISRRVRKVETEKNEARNRRSALNEMFDSNSISNEETVEISGGKIR